MIDPASLSIPVALALLAAAFSAGFVDAIAGGGGLITVPSLLATGLPPSIALATNKGQAAFGSLSSFLSYLRRGGIDRDRAPIAFVCGFLGSLAGARALLAIRPEPLRPIVLSLLIGAAVIVILPRKWKSEGPKPWAKRALAPLALVLGFYDGFFGPGVGTMLIVAFVVVFGDTLTRASGNAKVTNLASNLAALLLFALKGAVLWRIALPMAAANALGAWTGARVAIRRGDTFVRVVVVIVVTAVVVKMGWDILRR